MRLKFTSIKISKNKKNFKTGKFEIFGISKGFEISTFQVY